MASIELEVEGVSDRAIERAIRKRVGALRMLRSSAIVSPLASDDVLFWHSDLL